MERKTVQEESRDNETTTKASKRTSWKEVVCNGWSTQKETNPVETKLKMFFTSEHKPNLSTTPQEGTILASNYRQRINFSINLKDRA